MNKIRKFIRWFNYHTKSGKATPWTYKICFALLYFPIITCLIIGIFYEYWKIRKKELEESKKEYLEIKKQEVN